ncbi:hypothetical protein OAN95_01980 [Alphaproteobacteria bacterium]|nr:hypothetical protein [Alphaproteobacteria bacterium]
MLLSFLKDSWKNVAANTSLTFTSLAVRFFLVSIIIQEIGTEAYSSWIFWISITTYVTLADIGFIPFLQYRLLNMSKKRSRYLFKTYWRVANQTMLGVHLIIIVCGLTAFFTGQAPFFALLLLFATVLQNFGRLGQVFARANKKHHETILTFAFGNILFLASCALFINKGATLNQVSFFFLAFYGLSSLIIIRIGNRAQSKIKFWVNLLRNLFQTISIKYKTILKIFAASSWFTLNFSTPVLLNSVPIFTVTSYFGGEALVIFITTRMIYNLMFMTSNIVFISIIPEGFAKIVSVSSREKMRILASLCMFTTIYAGVFGIFLTAILDWLFLNWTGGSVATDIEVALSVFCLSVIQCLINLVLNVAGALGLSKHVSIANILGVTLSAFICLLLTICGVKIVLSSFILISICLPLFCGFVFSVVTIYVMVTRKELQSF